MRASPVTAAKVSVLLPTYNRQRFIAESLESIIGQTLPPSQVIVINDGSTDDTKAILGPFRGKIEYLECENRGKPSALNLGMTRVTGDYVWIMDDDDVALPDALSRHVAILESRPEAGWTYSSFIESATSEKDEGILPQAEKALPDFPEEEFLIRLMEQCFLIHPTILVRTSCYRQVGSFRTDLIRCQDYEMAVRLGRRFLSARVSGPTIYHRVHGGNRGSARDTFEAGQMQGKWLEYMQIFFRTLHRELPLSDYLPGRPACNSKAFDRRLAYLRRMAVMARKRLYDEMIEDLQLAQEDAARVSALSSAERHLLHETFNAITDPIFFQKDLLRRIRSVCRSPLGFTIRRELIRCLYWNAIGGIRTRNWSQMFGAASAVMQLAGAGVVRSFLHDRTSNWRAASFH
jgi:glycosyltransferase involved in cell wall biosynthesis